MECTCIELCPCIVHLYSALHVNSGFVNTLTGYTERAQCTCLWTYTARAQCLFSALTMYTSFAQWTCGCTESVYYMRSVLAAHPACKYSALCTALPHRVGQIWLIAHVVNDFNAPCVHIWASNAVLCVKIDATHSFSTQHCIPGKTFS